MGMSIDTISLVYCERVKSDKAVHTAYWAVMTYSKHSKYLFSYKLSSSSSFHERESLLSMSSLWEIIYFIHMYFNNIIIFFWKGEEI